MPARTEHPPRTRPRLVRGVLLALGLGALAACGSDEPDDTAAASTGSSSSSSAPVTASDMPTTASSPGEAESVTATEADFSISLDQDSLAAGSYEIEVVNNGGATHDLVVERDGSDVAASDSVGPGDTTTLTVDLEPGEYVFYCSIGNHRTMGMELTVEVT